MDQRRQANRAESRLTAEAAALDVYVEALIRGERLPVVSPPIDVRLLVLAAHLRVAGEAATDPDPAFVERLARRLRAAGMPARWTENGERVRHASVAQPRTGRA